jgi:subtilisin-like proprotein convertase family protein
MRNRLPKIIVASLLASLAITGSASADTRVFSNADNIATADFDGSNAGIDAAHYPSEIKVAGLPGSITGVEVKLKGVGTSFPGDMEVLLVSPAGQTVVLMSDVSGRNPLSSTSIGFSDNAGQSLTASDPIPKDSFFKPTNLAGNEDVYPRPAPAGPYTATTMAAFNGAEPNGKWKLYVADDAPGDLSHVSQGWDLTLTTTGGKIFRDNSPVIGGDRVSSSTAPAPANPYPASLNVSGLSQKIERVTVTLHDVDIKAATDMDLLLVGPTGQSAVLMSDVGAANDLSNADVAYDDAAATPVGFGQPILEGAHTPSDSDIGGNPDEPLGVDVFPEPAPQQQPGGALQAFTNSDPNGQWRLFLTDDRHTDVNVVNGGWSLNFTLLPEKIEQPTPAPAPAPAPAPQPAPAPAPAPVPVKPAPVQLTGLGLKPSVFRVNKGTTVRFRLSRAAKVKLTVKGRRGSLTRPGKAGANQLAFKPRKLKPGRYVLVAKSISAGSKERVVRFRVRR